MTSPTGSMRNLPYPLKNTEDMESVVGSAPVTNLDLSDWSESDPDIPIPIILELSLNEYVALANTIDVGRDIAYGDNSLYIWWLWVRSLESMSICDAIIACIDDEESGVMEAILENITLTSGNSAIDNGQSQGGLIFAEGANPTCDYDTMWAGIESVINRADTNNSDSLQILETATNINEWVAQVAGGLFGVELPIVQSLMDWALFIQQSILENYEAQITNAYLEELQCDLFCLAQETCTLTPEVLVNYFYERLNSQLTIGSLINETAEYLVTGSWSGTEIADVMFLSQFAFRAQLGRWFEDIAFGSIDLDMRIGYTDANDNWELLCDECGWTSVLDLTSSDYGFIFDTDDNSDPVGVWTDTVGLVAVPIVYSGNNRRQLSGSWDFDLSTVTSLRLVGNFTRGSVPGYAETYVCIRGQYELVDVGVGTDVTRQYNNYTVGVPTALDRSESGYSVSADELFLFVRAAIQDNDGAGTIHTVTITGTGTKPAQLP